MSVGTRTRTILVKSIVKVSSGERANFRKKFREMIHKDRMFDKIYGICTFTYRNGYSHKHLFIHSTEHGLHIVMISEFKQGIRKIANGLQIEQNQPNYD